MARRRILKRRVRSAKRYIRASSQSKAIKLREQNPLSSFIGLQRETLSKVLVESLMEGDAEAFKEVLRAFLEANNKSRVAKKMGVSRKTLYNLVSEEGNPTLNNITKLLKAVA